VAEAHKLGLPVIGVVDTNSDPEVVTHPIPGNDDAIRSIQLLTRAVSDAIREGASKAHDTREATLRAGAIPVETFQKVPRRAIAAAFCRNAPRSMSTQARSCAVRD
jgi:small subunit ribosomal protein S2